MDPLLANNPSTGDIRRPLVLIGVTRMIQSDRTSAGEATEAYCPHCFLLVEGEVAGEWPPRPTRCPHCKLMIGPGRARSTPDAQPGARGTAAGVFAQQAREHRDEGVEVEPDRVRDAIRTVADNTGSR